MMKCAITSVLFLLLFNLLFETAQSEITPISNEFGRKSYVSSSREADDTMIRRIEEEMLLLNKSGDPIRDKRALGILLQGFMEALGYTVSPIQLASLPNPGTAAQMPVGAAAAPPAGGMQSMPQMAMMPGTMPAMMPNGSAAPPRQRETLRLTGLLNFGNSENTTNLLNHLAQYERTFHGNRSAPASMPPAAAPMPPMTAAPASGPDIDPRYARPPLKEPLFVKIPLPIAPDLPPPQPPSPMPLDSGYRNEFFGKDSSEEYSGSEDDEGRRGNFDEEDDDSHHREDFEFRHDKYHNSEDRNYENKDAGESHEQPRSKEKHVETGYRNNKSVENYNVESKEIRDPSEVAEEGPSGGSRFNHATFVDEPDWREEQDAKVYKIAAEQEARAEALAEENAEREKGKDRDRDEEEEFHQSREKEIDEANEERDARYEKKQYREDDDDDDDDEEEGTPEKDPRNYKDDEDEGEVKEADHEEKGTQRTEARAQLPTDAPAQQPKNYQDADFYPATLPISYNRDVPPQGQTLRDSYGASLEKPGGRVDERVAEYITMFKNPRTGVYDPERVHEYEHARVSFEHGDLVDGFNRIQKEYGLPENKYEEYEIDGERAEHRGNVEDESRESGPPKSECRCNEKKTKKKVDAQGARSSERSVTRTPPLTITSPQPDFGYGPYYSTMKYTYDPLEQERNREIIARLTTYDTPTTARFEDHVDVMHKHSGSTVGPTIPPERFTTMSFLHEAEAKEIRAWPAPFDYLYDNSERKNVVYKKPPPVASSPAPFKPTRPSCNQHMMPFAEHKDKVKLTFSDHSGERYTVDRISNEPSSFHESRKAKPSEKVHKRVEYFPNFHTTQPTIFEKRKRPQSSERYSNYRASTKPPSRSPTLTDIITARPERPRSTKSPRKTRKNVKFIDHTPQSAAANHRESTIKPTIKVKYTYPFGRILGNAKEETTNYAEKDGMLIIPEPTPYFFNEGFDEFTEEPESNTERVQIKEYRNHIASVKVSELKQLHPEGSMQIFKYTRNL